MARITKKYFVIYDSNKQIIDMGPVQASFIATGQEHAEFDTPGELSGFINDQGLRMPETGGIC